MLSFWQLFTNFHRLSGDLLKQRLLSGERMQNNLILRMECKALWFPFQGVKKLSQRHDVTQILSNKRGRPCLQLIYEHKKVADFTKWSVSRGEKIKILWSVFFRILFENMQVSVWLSVETCCRMITQTIAFTTERTNVFVCTNSKMCRYELSPVGQLAGLLMSTRALDQRRGRAVIFTE